MKALQLQRCAAKENPIRLSKLPLRAVNYDAVVLRLNVFSASHLNADLGIWDHAWPGQDITNPLPWIRFPLAETPQTDKLA